MRTRKTQNSLRIIGLFYHCGYLGPTQYMLVVIERLSTEPMRLLVRKVDHCISFS